MIDKFDFNNRKGMKTVLFHFYAFFVSIGLIFYKSKN